jgi:ribonuclease J
MRITIHRGNQIGGCITEIESEKGTKIFVDLGHNLPQGDKESPDEFASYEAVAELTSGAKAIFYTHMHDDHIGLFPYVPEGIEEYLGPLAREIMLTKFRHMSFCETLREYSLHCLKMLEQFETYRKGQRIAVDDIIVTPFPVNHSAADSYMLKIQCDGKTILHTGDFRGQVPVVESDVDVLITEGTNVDNVEKSTLPESALKEGFKSVFRNYKNTFVLCSSTDADRLESLYRADCEAANRPFIVDSLQKQIIGLLGLQGKQTIYSYDPNVPKMEYMMRRYGFVMLIRRGEKFRDYLDNILPFCKPDETCLVYSQFHGYIEQRADNPAFSQSLYDFVESFRTRGITVREDLHASGHASREDLARFCAQINPRAIIPIHKDANADFAAILPEALRGRLRIPRDGGGSVLPAPYVRTHGRHQ